ncbi:hypothetical protein BG003_001224 [Podila horticola]|nr:hypothetical protein BG003_001224 [Podila horticola]
MNRLLFIAALLACFTLARLDAVPLPDDTAGTTSDGTTDNGSDDTTIAPADEPEQRITFDVQCVHSVLQDFDSLMQSNPPLDQLFTDCLALAEVVGIADDFSCLTYSYEEWLNVKYPNTDEDTQNTQDDDAQSKLDHNPLDRLPSCFGIATTPEQPTGEPDNSGPANQPTEPAPSDPPPA